MWFFIGVQKVNMQDDLSSKKKKPGPIRCGGHFHRFITVVQKIQIAAINGSTSQISRTGALVDAIGAALAERISLQIVPIDLSKIGPRIGAATSSADLDDASREAIRAIEQSDLIIAASPVYKGSYAGLFKHLIDFIAPEALVGRPVILAATGGGTRHALVVEHQLRPLFAFFRSLTLPTAIYASDADFQSYRVTSSELKDRIAEAAAQAASIFHGRTSEIEAAQELLLEAA